MYHKDSSKAILLRKIENHVGVGNAIKRTELANSLNLSSRQISNIVKQLRLDGVPIVISQEGYYYASTETDYEECLSYVKLEQMRLRNAARKLQNVMYGGE